MKTIKAEHKELRSRDLFIATLKDKTLDLGILHARDRSKFFIRLRHKGLIYLIEDKQPYAKFIDEKQKLLLAEHSLVVSDCEIYGIKQPFIYHEAYNSKGSMRIQLHPKTHVILKYRSWSQNQWQPIPKR
jgi:hypothetical protein